MARFVLFFEVDFVSDDDGLYLVVRVVLDLEEPLIEVFEAVSLGQIEDEEGRDGTLVI
jgi:hypothetical protein